MSNKKYYWLKLKRDFFKRHDIRIIESMPNGKDYILFYLKLLLESIDHEGTLRFSETIPYDENMLSIVTNTNIDVVRSAMKIFAELNMIDVFDDRTIYMAEVQNLIGSETKWAEKKRIQRAKEDNVLTLSSNCPIEIDIKKDKETEKDLEINMDDISPTASPKPTRHKHGMYNNVLLTDEEYAKLQVEFPHDYTDRIDRLSEYIESTGKKYKSHFATIRAWSRRDKTTQNNTTKEKSSNPFLDMLMEE